MAMPQAAIGKIVFFDRANKRGVIVPQQDNIAQQGVPKDLYFKVGDEQVQHFREGQLVRFSIVQVNGRDEATDIGVLSESA